MHPFDHEHIGLVEILALAPVYSVFGSTFLCMKQSIKHFTNNSWNPRWLTWHLIYPLFNVVVGFSIVVFFLIFLLDYDAKYSDNMIPISSIHINPFHALSIYTSCLICSYFAPSKGHFDDWNYFDPLDHTSALTPNDSDLKTKSPLPYVAKFFSPPGMKIEEEELKIDADSASRDDKKVA